MFEFRALAIAVTTLTFASLSWAQLDIEEKNVEFSGAGNIKLEGTLTKPATASSKLPAVLLLPGSGPTDRNGNQPPTIQTDLLLQIAHELAKNGVISFRFDKRASHARRATWPKDLPEFTEFLSWQNQAADVEAAFAVLKTSENVDPSKVAILGHSEGEIFAVALEPVLRPYKVILVATPGRPLVELMTSQLDALLTRQRADTLVKNQYLLANQELQKSIIMQARIPENTPPGLAALYGGPVATRFLQVMLPLNPSALSRRLEAPTLVIQGQSDMQVSPTLDAALLYSSLQSRANSAQELFLIPNASHNLKAFAKVTDSGFAGPVVPAALHKILAWLKSDVHRR